MKVGILGTPRPAPGLTVPLVAGSAVVTVALPIFVLAGWPLRGWALGTVLWTASQLLGLALSRIRVGPDNLGGSGVVGFAMMFRPVAVMVVVIAVASSDAAVGVAAGLVYALAYTLELGVALAGYFGSTR